MYTDGNTLEKMLLRFDPEIVARENWDAYSVEYGPQSVMCRFSEVFLN
jgi:hypothetical protein